MKIVTSLQTLMCYAREVGEAKKSGDPQRIAEAQRKHDEYKALCLRADEMLTG